MQIPMELTFRNVEKTAEIERLIDEKTQSLNRLNESLVSCRVAVERPQEHQRNGNPYRVRIDLRMPPGHELVVESKPRQHPMHESLHAVLTDTFAAAERRLRRLTERMQGKVKRHPAQEMDGVIDRIFIENGYGFIRGLEGTEYYFHRNSVVHDDFERLKPGTGVRLVAEPGEKGLQASTVEIVDKPSRL